MPRKKRSDRYHHGDLRKALVETAIAIVEEDGMGALTTRAIARRLGVSHAAPHRHFPTHADLLAEVAAQSFEMFATALSKAGRHASAETALAEMGRAYVRFALEHPGLLHAMFSPAIGDLGSPPEHLQASAARAYEALEQAVRRAMLPNATDAAVSVAAFLAWSSVHGAAMLWLDGPMRHFFEGKNAKAQFLELSDAMIRAAAHSIAAPE